jgi:myosin heavy subunit
VKDLKHLKDSLSKESAQKEQIISDFMKSMNEIQDNLTTIKEKENIIKVNTDGSSEVTTDVKGQIEDDILSIYKLMLENKKKLEISEKKLRSSNLKTAEFQKMIERLTTQLEDKNKEIETMKALLAKSNIDIANLNTQIGELSQNIDSLAKESEQKAEVIQETTTELNTAYYVIGTNKELKTHGVITKEGGFIGIGRNSKLKSDFNKSYFTKVDIRDIKEIPVNSKKAEFLTTHPAGSFEKIGNKTIEKIVIKDSKEFWSVSKYLVIVVD